MPQIRWAMTVTLNEMWLPDRGYMNCEVDGCGRRTTMLGLSEVEKEQIRREVPQAVSQWEDGELFSGPDIMLYIQEHELGIAVCDCHR